ncbi:MAG TPA: hypothetical protein VG819_01005 [Rhizomicrobium sp.]|nr:hypothetical protein [Rhizomicrobium sp.]
MAAIPLKEGPGLHGKGFMENVAFDVAGGGQQDLSRPDASPDAASDRNVFRYHISLDAGFVANHKAIRTDVAFDLPVDLNVAGGSQRALDNQVGADDGRRRR